MGNSLPVRNLARTTRNTGEDMVNLKKTWAFAFAGVLVICIGALFFFERNEPVVPVKVYKATPAPQPSDRAASAHHARGHEPSHDIVSHSSLLHPEDTPSDGDDFDWRSDNTFDSPFPQGDPWNRLAPRETGVASSDSKDDATYPPRDWPKTADPELRAEYLHAQLLKQFGDIPAVHIIGAFELKTARGIPPTVEEYIAFLEAHNSLFPHETHRRTLEDIRKAVADGVKIVFE